MYQNNPIFYNHQLLALLQTLPVTPNSWLTFCFIAVFTIILVAAAVYMLSNVIGSHKAKEWSRFQIYEGLLSLLLLFAFGSIIFLFFLNPQTVFTQLNIVPSGCTTTTQIFTLASCDISQFNAASFGVASVIYYADYFTAFIPGVTITASPIPSAPKFIIFQVTLASIIPKGSTNIVSYSIEAILFALVFNQIQLIVIAGAVLFLAVFLSIGLVARTLGFARTFGGAMIAFGLGIGIVYPLLVAMTYGFIDVHLPILITCGSKLGGYYLATPACIVGQVATAILGLTFSGSALALNTASFTASGMGAIVGNAFLDFGYILAGLTIIPVLNFAIVDAFIIDFSSAIGEKMSFSSLFSNFI